MIPLGITAIGKTFHAVQNLKEPIMLPDHDFPIAIHYKLILSIYMLMNPKNNNNTLYNRQLAIFIHSQYHGGTSSASHIEDLKSLTQNNLLNKILKLENTIKPIWILLVDGGLDENP
ncbi:10656_t:CDS:1 [Cetraspora pellucida]|uniref:10656_t:CDS:1 n=1 Tax=Cetraspora pellucida TaxID=1433469 RepID=A0A9N9NR83_9GLOM|nr:10656_t:CDS:1 [Cetraspora pellucida]